jgi:hypothetical protein
MLKRSSGFQVRVTDIASSPVSDADIYVQLARKLPQPAAAPIDGEVAANWMQIESAHGKTNPLGELEFTNLALGNYKLDAAKPGWVVVRAEGGTSLGHDGQIVQVAVVVDQVALVLARWSNPEMIEHWFLLHADGRSPADMAQVPSAVMAKQMRSVFPHAIIAVGRSIHDSGSEMDNNVNYAVIEALHKERGWTKYRAAYRPWTANIEPQVLDVQAGISESTGVGSLVVNMVFPDGSAWSDVSGTPWTVRPVGLRGMESRARTVPVTPGVDLVLPAGQYALGSDSHLLESLLDSKSIDIVVGRPVVHRVTLSDKVGRGHVKLVGVQPDSNAGLSLCVWNNRSRATVLLADIQAEPDLWLPWDTQYLIEVDGCMPVRGSASVTTEGRVTLEAALVRKTN